LYLLNFQKELIRDENRHKSNLTRVIEGFETVMFKSKFDKWPQTTEVAVSEEGRGKVAGKFYWPVIFLANF
jgi:gelsolin